MFLLFNTTFTLPDLKLITCMLQNYKYVIMLREKNPNVSLRNHCEIGSPWVDGRLMMCRNVSAFIRSKITGHSRDIHLLILAQKQNKTKLHQLSYSSIVTIKLQSNLFIFNNFRWTSHCIQIGEEYAEIYQMHKKVNQPVQLKWICKSIWQPSWYIILDRCVQST